MCHNDECSLPRFPGGDQSQDDDDDDDDGHRVLYRAMVAGKVRKGRPWPAISWLRSMSI